MPSIYLSSETKKRLYQFINRSRVSPDFGSPKKLKNPNMAISFLLDFALRYEFEDLERFIKIPLLESSMKEEIFENEEKRNQIILKKLKELEDETHEGGES